MQVVSGEVVERGWWQALKWSGYFSRTAPQRDSLSDRRGMSESCWFVMNKLNVFCLRNSYQNWRIMSCCYPDANWYFFSLEVLSGSSGWLSGVINASILKSLAF